MPGNPSAGKVNYGIQKNSNNTHWLWSPNALSTSMIGLKMKEDLGSGWSLIGVVEAGFDPYSGMLINGPRSKADDNVNALANQTANYDSSAAGEPLAAAPRLCLRHRVSVAAPGVGGSA